MSGEEMPVQIIAHDLNNLLAAVTGFAEFLIEDLPQDSQQHAYAQAIHQGARRAQVMVEDLLRHAKENEGLQNQTAPVFSKPPIP
ncbi:MAG: hypothetical protein JWO78_1278 [Micavibrio sp.]|nr:hypothetical protein [Micavibrio sp.]